MMLARSLDGAALLRRVFGDQVTQCPRRGDALRVIAFITDRHVTAHILEHLGLTSDLVLLSDNYISPPHCSAYFATERRSLPHRTCYPR